MMRYRPVANASLTLALLLLLLAATLGPVPALNTPAQAAPAILAPLQDPSFGPIAPYNDGPATYSSIKNLGSDKVVVAFADSGNSGYGTAVIGDVTGDTIAYGSEYVFNEGSTAYVAVAALNVGKIVVAYRDTTNSMYGTVVIGDITGNTISFGEEQVFNEAATHWTSVASLSATKFVVCYQDGGASSHGKCMIGTVAGTTVTFGGGYAFNAGATGSLSVDDSLYLDDRFVVAFRDNDDSNRGKAIAGVVDGGGYFISYGAEHFWTGDTSSVSITSLDSWKFAVAYQDQDNSNYGTAVVLELSGDTVSSGSEYVFNEANTLLSSSFGIYRLSDTQFVLGYQNNTDDDGRVRIGTVSGTTIAYGNQTPFNSGSASDYIAVTGLGGNVAVSWRDDSDSGAGKSRVGILQGQPGDITAHKFNDLNGNGLLDAGEPALSGWAMSLYSGSGCAVSLLAAGVTDGSGNVVFSGLSAGDYSVEESLQAGWQNTTDLCQEVTLAEDGSEIINFGNQEEQPGDITVHKFADLNGNGILDAGEPALSGWTMDLYEGSGCSDPFEIAEGVTDGSGNVTFSGLTAGDYSVEETLQAGWQNTTDLCQDVTLAAGGSEIVNFGNQELPLDLGDAPDSYSTLLASNGARHAVVAGRSLGPIVDAEPDGEPTPLADGDDLNPPGAPDDEDGVALPPTLTIGHPSVLVTVDGGPSGGMLDAWIDFNGNGVFDHPAEHLFGGTSASLIAGPNPPLPFAVPGAAVPGPTYARFRLSSAGGLSPTGLAPDGEVEDYLVELQEPPVDFGDAPDSYGALLASNGARHSVFSGYGLGAVVDTEPDGQPSPSADGDDLNPPGAPDDEDGVALPPTLTIGHPSVLVTVDGGPSGGMLDAWIDFNGNGVFDHPAEHLFGGASASLISGPNPPLPFAVPAAAVPGPTYARFRLSNAGGLSPTGLAPDGEVEDYLVELASLQPNAIIVEKQTNPDGATDSFTFSGDALGSLKDGQWLLVGGLEPGTYTSQETVPAGWGLASIDCDDDNSSGDLNTATAIFQLEEGEIVKCTFTNALQGTIIVEKETDPPGATETFDFTSSFSGGFALPGGSSYTSVPLLPGHYWVSEVSIPSDWSLTSATCDDGSDPSAIDLGPGETVRCTFRNTKLSTINVEKETDPAGATELFEFSPSYGPNFALPGGSFHTSEPLLPGTYSVSEVNIPPAWSLTDATCDDGSDPSTISLDADDTVTCTFHNWLREATIGDWVWYDGNLNGIQDEGEPGIAGVTVELHSCVGDPMETTTTDADGFYAFEEVTMSNYVVAFVPPLGYEFTFPDQGDDDELDSDPDRDTGETECFGFDAHEDQLGWDAGLYVRPQQPPPPPAGTPFVPEASTLLLLGSGLTGLAGYATLQARARKRK